MRINLHTANRNVVHHAANANCAVLCGHSADRIVTAAKRLLGRKRQSDPASYKPEPSQSGSMCMPGQRSKSPANKRPRPVTADVSGFRNASAGQGERRPQFGRRS